MVASAALNICFDTNKQNKKARQALDVLSRHYTLLGSGRNRAVFKLKSGNYVIKFPLNEEGVADNDWEASICSNKHEGDEDDVQYPKTRYIELQGFVCCIMEYIEPCDSIDGMPDWIGFVDCGQVGYNKKGRLLAYDYCRY